MKNINRVLGNRIAAIVICINVLLISLISVLNNEKVLTHANAYIETPSSEGVFIGKQPALDAENGKFYFNCGDTYNGAWKSGKIHGLGEYYYSDLGSYVGGFIDGVRSGQGNYEWKDGSFYSGQWKEDKISGYGKYISAEGFTLEGRFSNNVFCEGKLFYEEKNNRYYFTISNARYDGKVTIHYKNGTKFTGKYSGKKITQGTITYSNGDKYIGTFNKGLKSGYGTYYWKSGACYIGYWGNDKLNGSGEYYYENDSQGYTLQGKFKNNKPQGRCFYVDRKNEKYITTWENGKCIKVEDDNGR